MSKRDYCLNTFLLMEILMIWTTFTRNFWHLMATPFWLSLGFAMVGGWLLGTWGAMTWTGTGNE